MCRLLTDPRPRRSKRGQPRIPWAALVYALLVKAGEGVKAHKLREDLEKDPRYRMLGGIREGYKNQQALSDETLSKFMAIRSCSTPSNAC